MVGSDQQELSVIYDTAVDGLIIETDVCSSCNSASAFNTSDSTTFDYEGNTYTYNLEDDFKYYNYTQARNATDDVYMTYQSIKAADFPFYAITAQDGKIFHDVDGILGFARQSSTPYN